MAVDSFLIENRLLKLELRDKFIVAQSAAARFVKSLSQKSLSNGPISRFIQLPAKCYIEYLTFYTS